MLVLRKLWLVWMPVLFVLVVAGCLGSRVSEPIRAEETVSDAGVFESVMTDKAAYRPGDTVRFGLKLQVPPAKGKLVVQYRHLNDMLDREEVKADDGSRVLEWDWKTPADDGRGYLAELFWMKDGKVTDHANIAVDVSSDWGKFPRYGYLADFGSMKREEREAVMDRLNRFHINGIQFYDWQWKHHMPMKLDGSGVPVDSWPDIANRNTSLETVKGYIDLAHGRGMKAMNYNLLFGAYEQYERDGVKPEWGLYRDPAHENQDRHPLPGSWASDIMIMNPANPEWLQYLFAQERKVFSLLPFDGWHVDQLGNRGTLFNYDGKSVSLMLSYGDMIKQAKDELNVDYVMNAVDQYGQMLIAKAPVKFLYSELWAGYPRYGDLKRAIDDNAKFSQGKLNTVLAAYMNYDMADRASTFNPPGVLLTDAVIFASGGAHLELGENMLAKEYFPNRSLRIPPELERRMTVYYDFLTAYENVLRDGMEELTGWKVESPAFEASDRPESGKVWSFAKRKGEELVVHLLNLRDAKLLEWKDGAGMQTQPQTLTDVTVNIPVKQDVKRVWVATPDAFGGSPVDLAFTRKNGVISVTLPSLQYWDMIVLE
jgi:dextranase